MTRSLTLEDLNTVREALRAWAAKQRPGPRASGGMIIDLMLATGARIGEILALRWADVALEEELAGAIPAGDSNPSAIGGRYRLWAQMQNRLRPVFSQVGAGSIGRANRI